MLLLKYSNDDIREAFLLTDSMAVDLFIAKPSQKYTDLLY